MKLTKNIKLYKYLILDLFLHFIFTTVGGVIFWVFTHNIVYSIIFILGGIFIDLDHLIDYFHYFKFKIFNLKKFLKGEYLKSGKVYFFFHSWELVFLFYGLGIIFKINELIIFAFGITIHLIIDNYKRHNKLFYFMLYRIINKFNVKKILPEYNK